jgi:hypothetical protein
LLTVFDCFLGSSINELMYSFPRVSCMLEVGCKGLTKFNLKFWGQEWVKGVTMSGYATLSSAKMGLAKSGAFCFLKCQIPFFCRWPPGKWQGDFTCHVHYILALCTCGFKILIYFFSQMIGNYFFSLPPPAPPLLTLSNKVNLLL